MSPHIGRDFGTLTLRLAVVIGHDGACILTVWILWCVSGISLFLGLFFPLDLCRGMWLSGHRSGAWEQHIWIGESCSVLCVLSLLDEGCALF